MLLEKIWEFRTGDLLVDDEASGNQNTPVKVGDRLQRDCKGHFEEAGYVSFPYSGSSAAFATHESILKILGTI